MAVQRAPQHPWLQRPDWAARRLVFRRGVFTTHNMGGAPLIERLVTGAFLLVLSPCVLGMVLVAWRELGIATTAPALAICVVLVVLVLRTSTAAFECICHLETLPGVMGGWFKSEVVMRLPTRPARCRAALSLVRRPRTRTPARKLWTDEYEVPQAPVAMEEFGRYRYPIRFRVPHAEQLAQTTGLAPPWELTDWHLAVQAEDANGRKYRAEFHVPIYATAHADPGEQAPGELTPDDSRRRQPG